MPYHDEEYPGQPLWQSVLLFCCKGMIEGIMVILFFWLLVQVLFTKQLEVHLQILLLVGLIVFCLCLILGCILCVRTSKIHLFNNNKPMTSAPAPAEPTTLAQSPPPSAALSLDREKYEELDGDTLEYPSTFTSPAPSEAGSSSLYFSSHTHAGSERKEHPKSYFSLRRLSTPPIMSPLYQPMDHSRASLPTLPKLGLLSKTRKFLERRRTITGGSISYTEHSRLTGPVAGSPSVLEELIPLAPLYYGSSTSYRRPASSIPCLHFTVAFSPEQRTLTVNMLGLSGTSHRLEDLSVLGSLPPLCPCPMQASAGCSLRPEPQRLILVFKVGSVEELKCCVLRVALNTQAFPSQRGTPLGELEVQCGGKDWKADYPFHFTEELSLSKWVLKKSLNSQEAPPSKGLSYSSQTLGQLFILLQYQTLAHRIKATVLRADNLTAVPQLPATPDLHVRINLHHQGLLTDTRETKGGCSTMWNTPFLFDLPQGDVSQLSLMLEFIVMQNQPHSKSTVLGRVLIGSEAPEAGRAHWRDMCSQGPIEPARWHAIQPEPL
ncbi:uncharacterized protein syt18b [Lampris incognitus]|uniref:uncharacterized protein syt18b n=1 Tax=Lampris incognitus TaxID=2546036 RepID=UPI0024B55201|nr:uncharacterized protein syt18b [Lampris incognitus]